MSDTTQDFDKPELRYFQANLEDGQPVIYVLTGELPETYKNAIKIEISTKLASCNQGGTAIVGHFSEKLQQDVLQLIGRDMVSLANSEAGLLDPNAGFRATKLSYRELNMLVNEMSALQEHRKALEHKLGKTPPPR